MLSKIINLNPFFNKKDCVSYIIFFTFAPMKKNKNQINFSWDKAQNSIPFLGMLNCFYTIKRKFSFDVFQYLKADPEKLQIVYANIRV